MAMTKKKQILYSSWFATSDDNMASLFMTNMHKAKFFMMILIAIFLFQTPYRTFKTLIELMRAIVRHV